MPVICIIMHYYVKLREYIMLYVYILHVKCWRTSAHGSRYLATYIKSGNIFYEMSPTQLIIKYEEI